MSGQVKGIITWTCIPIPQQAVMNGPDWTTLVLFVMYNNYNFDLNLIFNLYTKMCSHQQSGTVQKDGF